MRAYTKHIRTQYRADILRISQANNSKRRKRTPEQIQQADQDKKNFYLSKWNSLLEDATTAAQKDYCKRIIDYIEKYTRA